MLYNRNDLRYLEIAAPAVHKRAMNYHLFGGHPLLEFDFGRWEARVGNLG